MGNFGGAGFPMSLKRRKGSGNTYTLPNVKAYENSLYKETAYGYESHKRYLGLTLGDLVSTIVLGTLFLLFIGSIIFVWRKNITLSVFSCIGIGEGIPSLSSVGVEPRTQRISRIDIEMSVTKRT